LGARTHNAGSSDIGGDGTSLMPEGPSAGGVDIDGRPISLSLILTSRLAAETPTWAKKNAKPHELVKQQAAQAFGWLPLVFEPNLGQTDPQVLFLTRAAGMTSFLLRIGSVQRRPLPRTDRPPKGLA
jgi:hypothetical protein